MSLSGIRDAIKTILEGVSGIGEVHDYERYHTDAAKLRALHVTSGRLHSWTITRTRTQAEYRTNVQTERRHTFVLRGYYALDDVNASEKTFQTLVESIEAAFRSNDTLSGSCELAGPLQVERVEPVLFAGVLCHFAELSLWAQELVS